MGTRAKFTGSEEEIYKAYQSIWLGQLCGYSVITKHGTQKVRVSLVRMCRL